MACCPGEGNKVPALPSRNPNKKKEHKIYKKFIDQLEAFREMLDYDLNNNIRMVLEKKSYPNKGKPNASKDSEFLYIYYW